MDILKSPVYALCFDQRGYLFVGTRLGLYELDTANGTTRLLLRPVLGENTDFNINYIWGLDMDSNGKIWVATRGGGFYRYDPIKKIYTDYPMGNGLTTRELRDIYVDSLEHIWLSSFEGIFEYNQSSKKSTRLTPEDGLDNFNISLGRWNIMNNKIYSGSPGAFSVIDMYAGENSVKDLPVWITGIEIVDLPFHFNPDSLSDVVVPMNYKDNIIHFDFTSLSYTAKPKIPYAYFMEGFDKDWQMAGNARSATYNNLGGGAYTFKIKAMNADGSWSHHITSVHIEVTPACWQTGRFRLLVFTLVAAGIIVLVRRRIANIRKVADIRQEQASFHRKSAEMEMMALRTQMNPHFIFNCMNIIDGLIVGNRNAEAQDFLQKFSKLIRLILENSLHQLVPLHLDLEALKLYIELEMIRHSNQFDYVLDVEMTLEKDYKIPPLLLQPYVENAIIHGLRHGVDGKGKIWISLKKENEFVTVVIEDNGIGRERSIRLNAQNRKPHEPIGMHITAKRIELLKMMNPDWAGVEIIDLNQHGKTGTRIIIRLPLEFKFDQRSTPTH